MNNVSFTVPQRGEKKHLLDLSVMNVKQYKVDRLKQAEKLNPEQRSVRLMKEIQEQLHMKKLPNHIECFDNSNIQGSDAVAACVVFKKAKPSKKEYRKYIIKTVTGPDDYASMKEVVRRRYSRAIEEGSPPARPHHYRRWKGANGSGERSDRGRTSSGYPHSRTGQRPQAPHLGIVIRIPSADHRCEAKHSLVPSVGNIQNEVHRFAITFHRDKRSKSQVASALDNIKGIGEKRKTALLKTFKSVSRIRQASLEEIAAVVGEAAAKNIKENLTE